jgi:hypothetical protein
MVSYYPFPYGYKRGEAVLTCPYEHRVFTGLLRNLRMTIHIIRHSLA